MDHHRITEGVQRILGELPPNVTLVAAVKSRTADEAEAAVSAGVGCIGHNYVQEAEAMREHLTGTAQWHLIGHLQRNKAKRALALFDIIETVDSMRLARALDRLGAVQGEAVSVLVEINSGREESKSGVTPEVLDQFVEQIATLEHVRVEGLMTMGPPVGDPEESRAYFRIAREAFERLGANAPPGVDMRLLSMGMSNSWRQAVDEGSTMVRIGTEIFGPREG